MDFEGIRFRYEDAAEADYVFRDLTLTVPAGQRVGLVGRSGSGKTTLTKLLLRLSDVQEGHIYVDGQDVSRCTQQSLRRQVGYVPQEALLFHRSIRENIAYGRPDATDDEIRCWRRAPSWRTAPTPSSARRVVSTSPSGAARPAPSSRRSNRGG